MLFFIFDLKFSQKTNFYIYLKPIFQFVYKIQSHIRLEFCKRRFNRKRTKGANLAETQTELTKGFPDNEWLSRRQP